MKKIMMFAIAILALSLGACSKVPAGHVGVKVYTLGSSKGVDSETLKVGRYWIGWYEELYLFPTFTQNYVWDADKTKDSPGDESITFQTKEGLSVNADIGISYSIDADKAHIVFQKYRRQLPEITGIYLRNMVRDALVNIVGTKDVEEVYGAGKSEIMEAVESRVRKQVSSIGINIEKIYWIGSVRLPETVIQSLNAKIQATQMAQQRENEIQATKAEAQKKIEESKGVAMSIKLTAEAQAEANKILAASITKDLVNYKALEKWDGTLPRMTGGVVPFVNIDQEQKK